MRIHGNELKRDNEALESFYGHYKERFDKCKNNESIEALKNIIASNLYRLSMEAIITKDAIDQIFDRARHGPDINGTNTL